MSIEVQRPGEIVWWQMALRILFGGIVSVIAGVVGTAFGSKAGGVLLAFPTIMPAALTFLQQQDSKSASLSDLRGAFFGAVGLLVFAVVLIPLATRLPGLAALAVEAVIWLIVSATLVLLLHRFGPWKRAEQTEARSDRQARA